MNYGQYIFSLELNNPNSQVALSAKRTDTGRKLYINLTQNGEPYLITDECWVLFMATKADGTKIVHECSVVNNVVEYDLQEQTVASIGVMNCAIAVYGTVNNVAKKLESAMFNIVVYDSSIDIDEIISSDDYQAFISATGELKNLMLECETMLNTYAEQLSTLNNNLKVLAQSNSIDLMQSIPSFQNVEAGVLTYRWELDAKKFTLSSNTTEERKILIGTLELSNTVLDDQTVNLDIQGANNNAFIICTLTLNSGTTVTKTINKNDVVELKNNQFKVVQIEVCKASGYRGSAQIKISCDTAPTNKKLQQMITANKNAIAEINKQLEEGGGAGENGKSAYDIWLEQGNEGTEADFLASLKGADGTSITITGIEETQADGGVNLVFFSDGRTLSIWNGRKGTSGTSVTITGTSIKEDGSGQTVYFSDGKSIFVANGEDGAHGMSAYELWLAEGNEGEVEDFLASLKGEKGDRGATGVAGYTPQKGTDYFTESDKAELVTDVLEALPTWEGGSF